jgi:HEAT repeat protein
LSKRRLGDGATIIADPSTVAVLQEGLRSPHVGVVTYALDRLESIKHESLVTSLQALLSHSDPYVRHDVLLRIERLSLTTLLPAVRQRVELELSAPVRGIALRVLVELGASEVVEEVAAYLNHPDPSVKLGAIVGLLRAGGIEGILLAGGTLIELATAPTPHERVLAARALGDVGIPSFYRPLVPLLQDDAPKVRVAALEAAGKLKNAKLWPLVVQSLTDPAVRPAAAAALVSGGDAVLPELRALFSERAQPKYILIRAAQICGRIGGPGARALLEEHVACADTGVRGQVLAALNRAGYHVHGEGVTRIHSQVTAEIAFAAWLVAALADIGDGPEVALVRSALSYEFQQTHERLFLLLSFIYDPQAILRARDNLMNAAGGKRAYALEILDLLVAQDLKPGVFAVLDDLPPAERLQRLSTMFPQPRLERAARLRDVVTHSIARHPWVAACALYTLSRVSSPALPEIVRLGLSAPNVLVRETAAWVEWKLALQTLDCSGAAAADGTHIASPWRDRASPAGARTMLSTIEKVLTLKTVSIFARSPDETLVDIAAILEEVDIPEGHTIFEKGDIGSCLYIIADGRVRIHDGEHTLNELGTGGVFGEMAVLDAAPRVASATALDATRLLRLDQEPLYELMADRIEVVRAIVGVLSGHLRARLQDIAELSARIQELTNASHANAAMGASHEQL